MGGQSSSDTLSFTDTRQFNENLNQTVTFDDSNSNATFGVGPGSSWLSSQSEFDYLLQYTTSGGDYQMEWDKTYSQEATGINKIPEFDIRPSDFFQHFFIPLSAELTVGEYSEPAGDGEPQSLATWRGDANLVVGPAQYKVLGSDFEGTVTVDQYAYGTGDLKAAVQQDLSLTTPISRHVVNTVTYNEANYNGPALSVSVSRPAADDQHEKRAGYGAALQRRRLCILAGMGNELRRYGAAVELSLTTIPSPRSVLPVERSFIPGPGLGFEQRRTYSSLDAVRPRRIAAVRHRYQLEGPGR